MGLWLCRLLYRMSYRIADTSVGGPIGTVRSLFEFGPGSTLDMTLNNCLFAIMRGSGWFRRVLEGSD